MCRAPDSPVRGVLIVEVARAAREYAPLYTGDDQRTSVRPERQAAWPTITAAAIHTATATTTNSKTCPAARRDPIPARPALRAVARHRHGAGRVTIRPRRAARRPPR